jgi:cyclophilin family peptidyl-prolyl cis-trans isomerase
MSLRVRAIATAIAGLTLAACGTSTPSPAAASCPTAAPASAQTAQILSGAEVAIVTTNKGAFTITLDASSAPVAVANFVQLARCGFYEGISFHRVIPGFVAQAGDPQTKANHGDFDGLGTGGPGYRFDIEIPDASLTYRRYVVAMANAMQYDFSTGEIRGGTDTNGSQFFVMLADAPTLRPYYSPLGTVTAGTDVVDAIGQVPTDALDVPLDPVIIESIEITTAEAAASPS